MKFWNFGKSASSCYKGSVEKFGLGSYFKLNKIKGYHSSEVEISAKHRAELQELEKERNGVESSLNSEWDLLKDFDVNFETNYDRFLGEEMVENLNAMSSMERKMELCEIKPDVRKAIHGRVLEAQNEYSRLNKDLEQKEVECREREQEVFKASEVYANAESKYKENEFQGLGLEDKKDELEKSKEHYQEVRGFLEDAWNVLDDFDKNFETNYAKFLSKDDERKLDAMSEIERRMELCKMKPAARESFHKRAMEAQKNFSAADKAIQKQQRKLVGREKVVENIASVAQKMGSIDSKLGISQKMNDVATFVKGKVAKVATFGSKEELLKLQKQNEELQMENEALKKENSTVIMSNEKLQKDKNVIINQKKELNDDYKNLVSRFNLMKIDLAKKDNFSQIKLIGADGYVYNAELTKGEKVVEIKASKEREKAPEYEKATEQQVLG